MAKPGSEGIKRLNQKALAEASEVTLLRDEKDGRLAIRSRAVSSSLDIRSGFLSQAREPETGGVSITAATEQVLRRA